MNAALSDILRVCSEAEPTSVYRRYSGRGMFGKQCVGVGVSVSYAQHYKGVQGRSGTVDAMGLGAIIYWPTVDYEMLPEDVRKVFNQIEENNEVDNDL